MLEKKDLKDQVEFEDEEPTVTEKPAEPKEKKHKDIKKHPEYIKLAEENASLKDQLLRKQAEFENFRKRVNEERTKDRKYELQDFLLDAIETLDIFDLAVNAPTDDPKLKNYLVGFQMINNRLKNILEQNGVTVIDCLNKPFDPNTQSAIETVINNDVEENTVVQVVTRGYMYKDRVLRHAAVKVSKKSVESTEENK